MNKRNAVALDGTERPLRREYVVICNMFALSALNAVEGDGVPMIAVREQRRFIKLSLFFNENLQN